MLNEREVQKTSIVLVIVIRYFIKFVKFSNRYVQPAGRMSLSRLFCAAQFRCSLWYKYPTY